MKKREMHDKQVELANLLFEMGMSLDVIEKVAGVQSPDLFYDNLRLAVDKKKGLDYNEEQ